MCLLFFGLLLLISLNIINVKGSLGDRSQFYRQCLIQCYSNNCKLNIEFDIDDFNNGNLLSWSCEENCQYDCMWPTVEYFIKNEYKIPQFYGKWPFVRIFGLQEPASVIFSLLNFYAHAAMYLKFKKQVRLSMPMSIIWSYLTLICLNGWFWSAVFHARDTPFTEMMDYSCAFSIVISLLYTMLLRIFYFKNNISFFIITLIYISTFYTHLLHLWSGKIHYGYNMKVNVLFGLLTFFITMIWWYKNSKKLNHTYYIGWFNILSVIVTLLELADFPPIFWIFDAHSLWHASTFPLVYLLYRFMILDCHFLTKQLTIN